ALMNWRPVFRQARHPSAPLERIRKLILDRLSRQVAYKDVFPSALLFRQLILIDAFRVWRMSQYAPPLLPTHEHKRDQCPMTLPTRQPDAPQFRDPCGVTPRIPMRAADW